MMNPVRRLIIHVLNNDILKVLKGTFHLVKESKLLLDIMVSMVKVLKKQKQQ